MFYNHLSMSTQDTKARSGIDLELFFHITKEKQLHKHVS
jgi:hypothetical protein